MYSITIEFRISVMIFVDKSSGDPISSRHSNRIIWGTCLSSCIIAHCRRCAKSYKSVHWASFHSDAGRKTGTSNYSVRKPSPNMRLKRTVSRKPAKMSAETTTETMPKSSGMVSKRKLFKKPLIRSTIGNKHCWKNAMLKSKYISPHSPSKSTWYR